MSLWLRRKDPEGRTHVIASGWGQVVLVAFLPLLAILIALVLPCVKWLLEWIGAN